MTYFSVERTWYVTANYGRRFRIEITRHMHPDAGRFIEGTDYRYGHRISGLTADGNSMLISEGSGAHTTEQEALDEATRTIDVSIISEVARSKMVQHWPGLINEVCNNRMSISDAYAILDSTDPDKGWLARFPG